MAIIGTELILGFLVSLVVSSIIIYLAAKLLGEEEGFGTAILAALCGTVIFSLVSYLIGVGWIATLVAGFAWLIALGSLYSIGWIKSFVIALIIWVLATLISRILPTLMGPF